MREHVKEAIADLADEALGRQFDSDVRIEDALTHVDDVLAQAWLSDQLRGRMAQGILSDVIEQQFTEGTARSFLAGLLNCIAKSPERESRLAYSADKLTAAFKLHVAADLQYQAQTRVDNWEPTDEQMSRGSYASRVDDPIIGDRRAIARAYR